MQTKQAKTADTLELEQSNSIQYTTTLSREMSQAQILGVLLNGLNFEEDDIHDKLSLIKEKIQGQLNLCENRQCVILKQHKIQDKIREITVSIQPSILINLKEEEQYSAQQYQSIYFSQLISSVKNLTSRIRSWRQEKIKIQRIKQRTQKMNKIIMIKYNMLNYLEQLNIVNNIVKRIDENMQKDIPQIQFLQEFSMKKNIPYHFYTDFCLQNICKVIEKRINNDTLIILKYTKSYKYLMNHINKYFFSTPELYEKCLNFTKLNRYIRYCDNKLKIMDNGFIIMFKPYFLQNIKGIQGLSYISFMKSGSFMQSFEQTRQIWKEFEYTKIQQYLLWYHFSINQLKKQSFINLNTVLHSFHHYNTHFSYIKQLRQSKNCIQNERDFIKNYMSNFLFQYSKDILKQLYFLKVTKQNHKQWSKQRKQYTKHWTFCIFNQYSLLYSALKSNLDKYISSLKFEDIQYDESQINLIEYYNYYKHVTTIFKQYLTDEFSLKQIDEFWKDIISKLLFWKNRKGLSQMQQFKEQFDSLQRLFYNENELQDIIKSKKNIKKQIFKQKINVYTSRIHLSSLDYFLIKNGLNNLEKGFQKDLSRLRGMVYDKFYKQS